MTANVREFVCSGTVKIQQVKASCTTFATLEHIFQNSPSPDTLELFVEDTEECPRLWNNKVIVVNGMLRKVKMLWRSHGCWRATLMPNV